MKKCELCDHNEATSMAANRKGTWKVICPCGDDSVYFYWIEKEHLDTNKKLTYWLDHLKQKNWFDKSQFMWAYRRLFK